MAVVYGPVMMNAYWWRDFKMISTWEVERQAFSFVSSPDLGLLVDP
jgi:hypothetical protein